MRTRIALALVLVGRLAAALPATGYVDVDALVRRQPSVAHAAALRAQAAALRAQAAALPAPVVPPPPATQPPAAPAGPPADGAALEQKAQALELELLRTALGDQVGRNRQRELAIRSQDLFTALTAYEEKGARAQDQWERSIAMSERYERINLEIQLAQPGLAATEQDRLRRELNTLDSLTDAVGNARLREAAQAKTRFSRQQVSGLQTRLEREAGEQQLSGERLVAQREQELAEENLRQEQYRLQHLRALGDLSLDLDLGPWRQRLAERRGEAAARQTDQRQSLLEAAARLEADARALEARGLDTERPRVLAWLREIQRRERIALKLTPTRGVPDVTAQVATLIASLESAPATLAPAQEVRLP